jgi:hypothetical protein
MVCRLADETVQHRVRQVSDTEQAYAWRLADGKNFAASPFPGGASGGSY